MEAVWDHVDEVRAHDVRQGCDVTNIEVVVAVPQAVGVGVHVVAVVYPKHLKRY